MTAVIDVLWWPKTWIDVGFILVPNDTRQSTTRRVWCSTCSRRLVEVLSSTVTTTATHGERMFSYMAAVQVCHGSATILTTQHFCARALKTPGTRSVRTQHFCARVLKTPGTRSVRTQHFCARVLKTPGTRCVRTQHFYAMVCFNWSQNEWL